MLWLVYMVEAVTLKFPWHLGWQLHLDPAQPCQFSMVLPLTFPASLRGLMHYTRGRCTGCLGSGSKQDLTHVLTLKHDSWGKQNIWLPKMGYIYQLRAWVEQGWV